jgi:hypothetical protein
VKVHGGSDYFHQAFGKGDEFGQEFFRARHGFREAQASSL